MKKIIVLGAGYGGLQAARALAGAGMEVLLFEAKPREQVGFSWPIDVEPSVFTDLKIPLPPETVRCPNSTYYVSTSRRPRVIAMPEADRCFHINGRSLSAELISLAEAAGVSFRFEMPVDRLLTDDQGIIRGIYLNGFPLEADLVIDSIGLMPGSFTHQKSRKMNGLLTVALPNTPKPSEPQKIFMMNPMGTPGIAELYQEADGTVRILIGRFDGADKNQLKIDLSKLRMELPLLSGKNIQDGTASVFPVRAPSLRMVDQGYACIDKSNFLSDALRSGQILAETVLQYGVSLPDLWRYQVRYYHQVVASSFYLQGVKYSLFTTDPKTLASAYEDNLLTDAMLQLIASRTRTPVGNDRLMPSFGRLLRKPLFSARLAKANAAGESIQSMAMQIPEQWNAEAFQTWEQTMLEKLNFN